MDLREYEEPKSVCCPDCDGSNQSRFMIGFWIYMGLLFLLWLFGVAIPQHSAKAAHAAQIRTR